MNNLMPINMNSTTLSDMKGDLTLALQDCLRKMHDTGSDAGKVTLTIQIRKELIPVTHEKEYRDATVPRFKWKAESFVPLKVALYGEFGGEWELASEDGNYGLKSLNGQTAIFDDEGEEE